MVTGIIAATLLVVAVALCVLGFRANLDSYRGKQSPGMFWTWAMVAFVPVSIIVGVPAWVLGANGLILLGALAFWVWDAKEMTR
jgi:hypothetical protein